MLPKVFDFSSSLGFLLTLWDVSSDGWTGYRFMNGHSYIKSVPDPHHISITNFNCTNITAEQAWWTHGTMDPFGRLKNPFSNLPSVKKTFFKNLSFLTIFNKGIKMICKWKI